MTRRLGLEITATELRGTWTTTWRLQPTDAFVQAWDGRDLASAVEALRAAHSAPDSIALAIGLDFLEAARVALPPADDAAREQIVALDPERYLGTNSPMHVLLPSGSDIAMGCDQAWLDGVLRTLQAWAPVTRVEATPVAVASSGCPDGTWQLDPDGSVEIRAGRVTSARRTHHDSSAVTLPSLGSLPGRSRAAWGALLREDDAAIGSLMPPAARRAADRRRAQSLVTAALGAVAAVLFLVAAVDRSRERTLAALDARAAQLGTEAAPALAAMSEHVDAARATGVARDVVRGRPDPLSTLAALGTLLPRDVVVTSIRMNGSEWQVDGTAKTAAALVPLLDADPRFDQVRSLGASARFRDGRSTRESFSITFHVATSD